MAARWWTVVDGGVHVTVRVMPGARRSEIVDVSGDALRIRIAAPAREGKANAEVERFLAAAFGVRPSAVSIVRGAHSRDKVVAIAGVSAPPAELTANP